jgi:hypothetical protein
MDDIITKLTVLLETRLDNFFQHASSSLKVDKNILIDLWKETALSNDDKPQKSKKSHYQLFFSAKRLELKRKDPSLNFGELSKQISKMWNSMNKQEQTEWVQTNHGVVEVVNKTNDNLKNIKIDQLRTMCASKGFKTTGNKAELIKLLSNPTEAVVEKKNKLTVTKPLPSNDLSVHISDSIGEKRSQIEEGKVEDSQEEEEFVFDEEDEEEEEVSSDDDFDDNDGDDEA